MKHVRLRTPARRRLSIGAATLLILLVAALITPSVAFAAEEAASANGNEEVAAATITGNFGDIPILWFIAPIAAIIGLVFARVFFLEMKKADPGSEVMQGIAKDVQDGAMAYLKRQYGVLLVFFIIVAVILAGLAVAGLQEGLVPFGFLLAGTLSGLSGFLGMRTATHASSRTAAACRDAENGLNRGLRVAFRSGAVMGLVVVSLALLDVSFWFLILFSGVLEGVLGEFTIQKLAGLMLAFGMGASAQALFARVGGGIYTKAADVGADLVGKVEAGIPEDDPRNPATIADNVGDNVGDVAGMGADLYESYYGSMLASAALGAAAAALLATGTDMSFSQQLSFMLLPSLIAGVGVLLSIAGIFLVKTREGASFSELMHALHQPIYIVGAAIAVVAFLLVFYMLGFDHWGIALSVIIGLAAGIWIGNRTEYYTSYDHKPTQDISKQAEYGPATVIIDGVATGMWSTMWPVVTIAAAILFAFGFAGGFAEPALGLYGIGLAAVGMLSTLGFTLATDAYGPIADNAGGNAEMASLDPAVRTRTDALDSLGNTTAATGKGFAIGSAALTAMALIASYVGIVRTAMPEEALMSDGEPIKDTYEAFMAHFQINPMNPLMLIGLFLGVMLAYAFCAMTMKAVGRASAAMVAEVRRQFRDIPGIMNYDPGDTSEENQKRRPQYAECVRISTIGAQREMILPASVAIAAPIVVGLVLGVAGVIGLLAGALAGGFILAIMMANSGGAWDNAKKWIETRGQLSLAEVWSDDAQAQEKVKKHEDVLGFTSDDMRFRARYSNANPERVIDEANNVKLKDLWEDKELFFKYLKEQPELWDLRPEVVVDGKSSNAHGAGVVGDTVGDPFKDTSGPSLNILIKLMAMVSLVFAGVTAQFGQSIAEWWQDIFRQMGG